MSGASKRIKGIAIGVAIAGLMLAACGSTTSEVTAEAPIETESQVTQEPGVDRRQETRGQMTPERLVAIVESLAEDVSSGNGGLQLTYEGVQMVVMWDESHDRMRIFSPVADVAQLSEREGQILLEANFHRTLDARYATSQGVLYATFIHPLSPLDDESTRSGIRQVAGLVQNFGTTYSSGELTFGGGQPEVAPEGFL
ncbi:type III secretion system chaperone [Synechococcus sp. PCC 7336]|uniref:type III secretion system chaperone n=1 Tax=Synechococcus sp. PCC 7336 TaxID=195250 RepID=UPI00034A60FE|nr:type III secretion system chaperone [Synechococcus sp. PCC 7336]